jgi:2-polyprenyl-3-methyl-5-hydroxy-6-metoxy-1,4-benzoquinol methylase
VPGDANNRYWVPVDAEAENDVHAHALAFVGRGKRVLELGCAAGHVTRALVDRHCEVVGIEADAEAASNLEGIAEAFVGDLTDPTIVQKAAEGRTFDVVLAGDVLEHLPDPASTLLACRDVLRADGYLVVSLPNVAHADVALSLLDGQFGYRDTGLLDRTHLRFFTLEGIHQLLEDAGFVGIEVRRVIRPIFETELAPDPAHFEPAVVERALAAPEAETYQFVLRAVPHSGDTEVAAMADRAIRAEDELRRGELHRLVLEAELAVVRDALLDCQRQLHELGERSGREGDELREQIERCETLIAALFSTKTLRAAAPFRAAYAATRRPDPRGA